MKRARTKSVVMVGASLDAPGGITSVVKAYKDAGLFEEWDVTYLSSFEDPRPFLQMKVMLCALSRFLRMLIGGKVALVHVHSASRGSFWRKSLFCLLGRLFRVPYIVHVHSGEFPVFFDGECGPLGKRCVQWVFEGAQKVLALTEQWGRALQVIAPGAVISVIGNPVAVPETQQIRIRRAAHVLFLRRLREKKGVFDLVQAIPRVLQRVPKARFTLAGDGAVEEVARQARALGVHHAVHLPGWVDATEKDSLLACADVVVLPSYYEGLPMCVLESMAAGVPVVSTEVGGIPEALDNGNCGRLVSPGDIDALADALVGCLSGGTEVDFMCKRAFFLVKQRYSVPVVMSSITELYRSALRLSKERAWRFGSDGAAFSAPGNGNVIGEERLTPSSAEPERNPAVTQKPMVTDGDASLPAAISRNVKILAVASGGGHWTQLMRLRGAFAGHDVAYVGVKEIYRQDVASHRFYAIPDVSRLHKFSIFGSVGMLLMILIREKPMVVITTGSAPGMLALRLGKLLRKKTVWIDSIANVEKMSLSGMKARKYADLWLTQWPHLEEEDGPHYMGSVL